MHEQTPPVPADGPVSGERWRHRHGCIYVVFCLAVHEPDCEPLVIYGSPESAYVWARPLSDWLAMVDGQPRFVRVDRIDGLNRVFAESLALLRKE
jgi:hypothetical protein